MRVKWYALVLGSIIGTMALSMPATSQISMQRPGLTGVPAGRALAAPAKPGTAWTPEEQERLAQMLSRMSPKERKKLAKALKHMTPAQRLQFHATLKQQLAKMGPPAQFAKHPR